MGVCPQQNVLFSYLTVKEHLELFAALKGVPKLYVDQDVQDMVTRLGLSDKMNSLASSLSGGMKRKLQVLTSVMRVFHFVITSSSRFFIKKKRNQEEPLSPGVSKFILHRTM